MHPTMNLIDLPPGADPPRLVNAIVEIQQDGSNKYEYDKELGLFKLDRVLFSAVHYPMGYGFIPGTQADDGDPLLKVWMSHGDRVEAVPAGFEITASSPNSPMAAMEDKERRFYGVQFHPEVTHTLHGDAIVRRFVREPVRRVTFFSSPSGCSMVVSLGRGFFGSSQS